VVSVVAFHFGAPLPGGFLGVDLFFVISGFVITRLLASAFSSGSGVRYGEFLSRRVRRLLPVLVVVLAATQLWLLTASDALQRAGDKQTMAAAGYVSNWYAIFGKQSYWDIHSDLTPLNHLWSLSVEEQFYLVWPWVLLLLVRFVPRRARAAVVLGFAAVSYALASGFGMVQPERAYLGTDTRAGALLLGAALALFLASRPSAHAMMTRSRLTPTIVGIIALGIFAGACALGWSVDSPALYAGGLVLVGLAEAALVWAVLHRGILERLFGSLPMRAIGRASYSIYLWHWVVWVAILSMPSVPESLRAVIALPTTAVLSIITYRFVERPLQRRAPRTVVACSVVALVLLALVAWATMPVEPALDGLPG